MTIDDYYMQLFGKTHIQDGNVIDFAEHGRIGGVSTGQGFKFVQILDNSGNPIVSFGGGTQYTEGDTDATIMGNALLWEDTSDTLRPVSAAKPLPVNIISGAGSGGTASQDDADFIAATTNGTPAMGVYESTPTAVTDGDMGIVGITANRELKVSVTSGATSGTQYTEGDTDATITGTAMMMEGAGNALVAAQGTAADGLLVNLGSNNDVTVTGTVTANLAAGTNNIGDVDVVSSALPTGASTLAEQQTQTTHLSTIAGDTTNIETAVQLIDDAIYTDGTGTVTKGVAILGQDGTNPQAIKTDASGELQIDVLSIAAGDNNIGNVDIVTVPAPLSTTGGGTEATALRVTIANDSTGVVSIDDNGSSVTVDGTVTANLAAGTNNIGDVDVLSIAAGDNNIGNVDIVTVPSDPFGANADAAATAGSTGSMQAKFRLMTSQLDSIKTAVETLDNTVGGSELQVDVVGSLPAGTNAIGKLSANSGVDIGDVDVTSLPALTAGTNAIGKLLPPDIDVTGHTNYARKYYTNAGAATDGIVWSPAAGKRWHVVSLFINVSAACTVTFEDDKAGGDDPVLKMELAANSGTVVPFPEKYPMASGEDAADLLITTSAGNVYVTVVGYEI